MNRIKRICGLNNIAGAALALLLLTALPALMHGETVEQNRVRKINVGTEGDHLYVKINGTARFRYRVKIEEKPPRITVQMYNTETDLGYDALEVNQGYVKDIKITEMTVSGQRAVFLIMHLSQTVRMDYGLSGDGRTLYIATPLFANASPETSIPEYSSEPAVESAPRVGAAPTGGAAPDLTGLPPEIYGPAGGATEVSLAPSSEFVSYGDSSGSFVDFGEDTGIDNSPYIVGPVILQDADISKVVQLLSEAAGGASIIVEATVLEESAKSIAEGASSGGGGGGVTMTLSHITLEDALDVITSANDWAWIKIANSYLIVSHVTAIKGLDTQDTAAYDVTADKLPISLYRARNQNACDLISYVNVIVPSAKCDAEKNLIIMKGRDSDVTRAKQILQEVDVAKPQGAPTAVEDYTGDSLEVTGRMLVTKVKRLQYIRAKDLEAQLKKLLDNPYFGDLSILTNDTAENLTAKLTEEHKLDTVAVDEDSNTLMFVGREEVWRRLVVVVEQLDVPYRARVVRTIELQRAFVADLKLDLTTELLENLGRDDNEILYNEMNNSVTFIGTEDDFDRFTQIIEDYDTDDKAIITESVPFTNISVSEIIQSKMLNPIMSSAQFGYSEIISGDESKSGKTSHTRITIHTPSNAFIITAQRRYIERVKSFLRSLDIDPQKVLTKVVRIKYINATRMLNVLEQMLRIEDVDVSPPRTSTNAPFLGNFYYCDQIWELKIDEGKVEYKINMCGYDRRFSVRTTPMLEDTNGQIHNLTMYVESAQNSIVIRGTEKDVKKSLEIIELVDVPYPQVRIDIQVIEVLRDDLKDFAKEFNIESGPLGLDSIGESGSTNILFDSTADFASRFISYITLLVQTNRANVLANPSIVSRENALSRVGFIDIYRYRVAGSVIIPGINEGTTQDVIKDEEVILGPLIWLVPHINTADNTVLLHMVPIYSSLTSVDVDGLPQTTQDHMEQELFVRSGETIIASGFITSSDLETTQRVPLLGNLPLVGNLFRSKSHKRTEKEVIFMITPTILPII